MDIAEREEKTSLNSDEDDNGDEGHGDGGDNEADQLTHKKENVIEEKEEASPSSAGEKNSQQNRWDDTSEED